MESYLWILFCYCITGIKGGELRMQEQQKALSRAQIQCYEKMASDPITLTGVFCPRQFDDILCWPDSVAGQTHKQHCPSYINRFDTSEFAYKTCSENGTWYISPETNETWTDYSHCIIQPKTVSPLLQENIPRVKVLYIIGYSLSLATLILAVFIMLYFRRLRCPRNLIHVNLFLVYLFRAFISLLKEILLVGDIGFPNDVIQREDGGYEFTTGLHVGCKIFFTLLNYMILASIIWIFIEGLYLQLLLSLSVHVKKLKLRWFILLGWGVPVLFAVAWGVGRYYYDDSYCWNVAHYKKNLYWIIRGPIVMAVILTFLIFVNILRLLFTKLTAVNCPSSRRYRYRRLAKSTIILVPLFAVYYMGFIWLPDDLDPMSQLIELYIEMLFNSFQGFLVALLFCFFNAEVQNEIRKKWYRHVLKRSGSINNRYSRRYRYSDADSIVSSNYPQATKKKKNKLLERVKAENAPLNKRRENGLQDHNDNIHPDFHSDFHSDIATSDFVHSDFHTDLHSDDSAIASENQHDIHRDPKVTFKGSTNADGQCAVHENQKMTHGDSKGVFNQTTLGGDPKEFDSDQPISDSSVIHSDSNVVQCDQNDVHSDSNVMYDNSNTAQSDTNIVHSDSNSVYSDSTNPAFSNSLCNVNDCHEVFDSDPTTAYCLQSDFFAESNFQSLKAGDSDSKLLNLDKNVHASDSYMNKDLYGANGDNNDLNSAPNLVTGSSDEHVKSNSSIFSDLIMDQKLKSDPSILKDHTVK